MSSDAMQLGEVGPRDGAKTHAQDVPPGYKRTEVGVIPADWKISTFDRVCTRINGKPYQIYTDAYQVHGALPVVDQGQSHIVGYTDDEDRRFPCPAGGVIVFGDHTCVVKFVDHDFVVGADGTQIIATKPNHCAHFHAFALQLRGIPPTGYNRHFKFLKERLFVCPGPLEQRAIAEALSDVDGLLGALEVLIAKKRAIKQAAMQQLLTGKTRLPGFSGEWETKRLGEIGEISGAGVDKKTRPSEVPVRLLNYLDVYHKTFLRSIDLGHVVSAKPDHARRCMVLKGDVFFTPTSEVPDDIGRSAIAMEDIEDAAYSYHVVRLRLTVDWDLRFRAYVFDTKAFLDEASRACEGSGTRYVITLPRFRALPVRFPTDASEQAAIAAALSDMDAEIAALEGRRDKTRAIKQGMMQRLLTGRVRLVKPSSEASNEVSAQEVGRKANVHFVRSVLAAEIIDRLHEHPTFGHVKFEKMMFLVEKLCDIETGSTYLRNAAGPYDNRALRSIDSQIRRQQWFDARKEGRRYQYVPMQKRGGHKKYFDRYFPGIGKTFAAILEAFKALDTEQCEIVATLLATWNDLSSDGSNVPDQLIVHEVLNNWHESKRRIPEERWLAALVWMREKNFVPKGVA